MVAPVSTVVEIERAIEELPLEEQRELFEFLAGRLKGEVDDPVFPDLKKLLLEIPDAGSEEDFLRLREMPRDLDLS